MPPWNKNVPEIIKIDHVRFLIYLHQQPLDAKRYKTSIYQSKPKQPKANQSNPKLTMTTTNALFKVYIENMPEALNTKKDVDEYCKQFWKDNKEKVKEEKAAEKAAKAAKAEKPKRKKGFDKDGNPKEKRAPSAYNIFVKEKYAEIKADNTDLDRTQIFSEIARLWQETKAARVQPENVKEPEQDDDISEIQEVPSDEEAPKKKRVRKAKKAIETDE